MYSLKLVVVYMNYRNDQKYGNLPGGYYP